MLTVIVLAGGDPTPLEATLRSLVSGAVDGLVAEVWVATVEAEAVRPLCAPMGAELHAPDNIAMALEGARGRWLMVLEAGGCPAEGWERTVAAHLQGASRPARFEVRGSVEPFWRRLFGRASRPLLAGFLMPVTAARSALRSTSIDRLPVGRAAVTLPVALLYPLG